MMFEDEFNVKYELFENFCDESLKTPAGGECTADYNYETVAALR